MKALQEGDEPYGVEVLDALEIAFSPERLRTYKAACGGNLSQAIYLYNWNTTISQALYGPLQVFEITTRNAINRQLAVKYGDKWFEVSKPVIFADTQSEKIAKVVARFDKNRAIVLGDVVADLSFGFWSDLVAHQFYDELWKVALHRAFPNRPRGTKRSTLANPFIRLNTLRNRIAHHEPIWNRDLERDYKLTIELTSWICPITSDWADKNNDFRERFSLKRRG